MARILTAALLTALLTAGCGQSPSTRNTESSAEAIEVRPVNLKTEDGVAIVGRYYRVAKPKAMILLFHQAGSSKDEYVSIAPRLNREGYSALAIDQRSGGDLFGRNETVALAPHPADESEEAGYLAAELDLQAAVDWTAKNQVHPVPIILWGSSYSAALVFDVAASNPDKVAAVLAFSPDEYLPNKHFVSHAAATLNIPVFIDSASDPKEIAAGKAIAAAVPAGHATQYVPADGVHGSSTLIDAKNPKGAGANWQAVLAFLAQVAP